jgi:hypothetical protein
LISRGHVSEEADQLVLLEANSGKRKRGLEKLSIKKT